MRYHLAPSQRSQQPQEKQTAAWCGPADTAAHHIIKQQYDTSGGHRPTVEMHERMMKGKKREERSGEEEEDDPTNKSAFFY